MNVSAAPSRAARSSGSPSCGLNTAALPQPLSARSLEASSRSEERCVSSVAMSHQSSASLCPSSPTSSRVARARPCGRPPGLPEMLSGLGKAIEPGFIANAKQMGVANLPPELDDPDVEITPELIIKTFRDVAWHYFPQLAPEGEVH